MLRRSQSKTNEALMALPTSTRSLTLPPKRLPEFIDTSEESQKKSINNLFQSHYGYDGRAEQNQSAVDLLHGRAVFLLAGTGFGKSRVPEVFYLAHDLKNYAPIVLCINPLDSLGDDQVSEKSKVHLNSVNLNGPNCTQDNCDAILQGKYGFVYVSPEVALTNTHFDKMWRDQRFQNRLILNVVDEAHMVNEWGLVESGQAKRLASHVRVQDGGVFRPSYGELARRFLSSANVPILLMTATCTPQAIHAILANLKLDSRDVRFPIAELTRPEIRFIRRSFKRPLKSSVRGIFPHHAVVPTKDIIPTLLYAGTQNNTLEFLIMIHTSRGQPNEAGNGHSDFARRYHANTGPKSKLDAVAMYVAGSLAVLCCTLALGLGQNWKRVRRVIIVGRQHPGNFVQMSGRSGRDGRRGLGILLVEHNRTNGKNKITDFKTPTVMSDDDRMDALAITPVCLRVAIAVDLRLGYIPLKVDDMCVTEEVQRQEKANMRLCDCSNCQPEAAEALWLAQPAMTVNNFDDALAMGETELLQLVEDLPEAPLTDPAEIRHVAQVCHTDNPIEAIPLLETLVSYLDRAFHDFFYQIFTDASDLGPPDYFPRELAWNIAKNIDIITKPSDLALVLSSETILGQFDCLFVAFCQWKNAYPTAVLIADAAKRREVSYRANKSNKAPQSCEGAQIAKERADLAKAASKLATASAKEAEKAAKDAQKAAKDAHKAAKEQERSMKDAAMALCHATQHGLPIPPSTTSKRHAEGILEGEPCKFKGKAQTTTHPKHPTDSAMIDPRLCQPGSI